MSSHFLTLYSSACDSLDIVLLKPDEQCRDGDGHQGGGGAECGEVLLDLLTLSVEAGMDFMSALQRNCERRKLDPLNEELIRMTSEIQVGTPRRVALRNMAARVRQPDLSSVAYALVQADELGVSIGSILRIQSDQLRSRRFDRAEKMANEAPVKLLGPLMLCIFPAVFVILLGPILSQAVKNIF